MKPVLLTSLMLIAVMSASWIIGCAPADFSKEPQTCSDPNGGTCVVTPSGNNQYDYTVNTSSLPLDILVVSDNSGSMSRDQRSLGSKFPAFLNLVKSFDYHIGVTTTDVAGSGKPGRDGSLIAMGGASYLTRSSVNAQSLFQAAVQRPETATCDQYLKTHNCAVQSCADYYNYCPSDDSRAIYAANLVVDHNDSSFLRPTAPLHVIILSNADERVVGGADPQRPMETRDQPSSLIQNVRAKFGAAKALRVHTIVIQPNDSTCLRQEAYSATVFGQYAPIYASLSTQTGGVRGTICASDYTAQLQQIAQVATSSLQRDFGMNCKTSDTHLTYTVTPAQPSNVAHVDSTGLVLRFTQPLPQNTSVHLNYTCE